MESAKPIKITDPKVGYSKAEHFCAYQERAQQEVRDKLYEWGLWPEAVENIIVQLIGGNFINEERFAKTYTKGKFSQKGWGRIKIKQGLKFKKVPEVLIKKAMLIITPEDYLLTLEKALTKKDKTITEKDPYKRKYKLQQYALSRGFENDLITDVLRELMVD